jgi:hypothetical protein
LTVESYSLPQPTSAMATNPTNRRFANSSIDRL